MHALYGQACTCSKFQDRIVYCQGTDSLQKAISYINGKASGANYALEIVCMQNPSCEKIGESWFCCFQSCHSEKLKAAWTKSPDTHAAAVNPTTITHYFQLLKATLDNSNFMPECQSMS